MANSGRLDKYAEWYELTPLGTSVLASAPTFLDDIESSIRTAIADETVTELTEAVFEEEAATTGQESTDLGANLDSLKETLPQLQQATRRLIAMGEREDNLESIERANAEWLNGGI